MPMAMTLASPLSCRPNPVASRPTSSASLNRSVSRMSGVGPFDGGMVVVVVVVGDVVVVGAVVVVVVDVVVVVEVVVVVVVVVDDPAGRRARRTPMVLSCLIEAV